jgi:peptide deformylase
MGEEKQDSFISDRIRIHRQSLSAQSTANHADPRSKQTKLVHSTIISGYGLFTSRQPAENFLVSRLTVLEYPDPRLQRIAQPVSRFDAALRQLIADMAETMYAAPGVGLAATQVDVHQRVVVIDVSELKDQLRVFVNPEIVWRSEETRLGEEGCLSVPEIYDEVCRPQCVRVRAHNEHGKAFEIDCDELLSVCVQHEIDHLNGKLFVDYLSPLKRSRIKAKLKKRKAREAA